MTDISVQNVTKAFEEGNNILDGLSFEVAEGERVGLLGKNGAGKTTLFRIMAGELEADEGEIVIPKNKRLGLISQIPRYPEGFTTEDVLVTAQQHVLDMGARMRALEAQMADGHSRELLAQYDALAFEFERAGGYDLEFERNRVANGLDVSARLRGQLFSTLSGGEKTRINLARLILEDTDILLLDEPTNHLDLTAAQWLEGYLSRYRGTVLVISHDRYFLDSVVTRTIEITGGKASLYSGNYSFYVAEKERRYLEQLKRYEAEQAEARRLQESADRLYQWGTGNSALMKKSLAIRSRIDRVIKTDRPETERRLAGRFGEKSFMGDDVLVLRDVSKGFDGKTLFSGVELTVRGGERIALLGDNGTGKSTLIKIILGELRPDGGAVKIGPSVKTAYLPQIIRFPHPDRSVLDTLVHGSNCSPQSARNRLGAFKFTGDDVFKRVRELSGGEQSRLRLCALMQDGVNFLILDEPTNHLDILSREWIEEAVEEYGETLLFVSHDRYFIKRFATRIWALENGRITDFRGTYEQYLAHRAKETAPGPPVAKKDTRPKGARPKGGASTEKQVARIEREIAALEEQMAVFAAEKERHCTDYERLMELDGEEARLRETLDTAYGKWALLAED